MIGRQICIIYYVYCSYFCPDSRNIWVETRVLRHGSRLRVSARLIKQRIGLYYSLFMKKVHHQWRTCIRAWNGVRIWRVLLVSVPTCNRSLIYHNRRVWQIKSTRSCRSIFHGDHQIQLSQLLETQHFSAKLCPFWSYWHLCKANSAYGAITSCKIQFWMSFHLLSTSLPADFATNRLATVPLHRTRESQLDIGDSSL